MNGIQYIAVLLAFFTGYSCAAQDYITLEQFGAVGNNEKDETEQIINAFRQAREKKLPVRLLNKTYKLSPQQTLDITGIPAIAGKGVFDASGAGPNAGNKRMNYLFSITGEKKLLQSELKGITAGKNTITLKKGLDIAKEDVLFITSLEPLPNNKRKYNRKGQRVIVSAYDKTSGNLTIRDSLWFTIEKANIWKNDKQPYIEIGKEIHFITSPMNFMSCIQLIYAKGKISGSYENFSLAAVYFRSSSGTVENADIRLPVNKNNGYSYGVAVSDMSDVLVKDCVIDGGRHAVCGTSGGLWTADESGGYGKEKLGYPVSLVIDGGKYSTSYDINAGLNEHLGTIDSHGSVYRMTVKNCEVHGGISLGANYAETVNTTIYTGEKRAFNFGSDVLPGSAWGHYYVSGAAIHITSPKVKSVLFGKSDVKEINLSGITLQGAQDQTVVADFKDYAPSVFVIDNMNIRGVANPKIWINDKTRLAIKKSSFDQRSVRLIKRNPLPPSNMD